MLTCHKLVNFSVRLIVWRITWLQSSISQYDQFQIGQCGKISHVIRLFIKASLSYTFPFIHIFPIPVLSSVSIRCLKALRFVFVFVAGISCVDENSKDIGISSIYIIKTTCFNHFMGIIWHQKALYWLIFI